MPQVSCSFSVFKFVAYITLEKLSHLVESVVEEIAAYSDPRRLGFSSLGLVHLCPVDST